MKKIFTIVLLILISCLASAQTSELFDRLQGISNNGVDFFNVDGIEITKQTKTMAFNAKNIAKYFKQLGVKEKELTQTDSIIGFSNFYVRKSDEKKKGLINYISYYFIQSKNGEVTAFTFATINKISIEFERQFVKLALDNAIPKEVFNSPTIDSINFAGRKIPLGSSCNWMGVNNVQCRYYGQMNWSVHKSFDDAKQSVNNHFLSISSRNNGKVILDTTVAVIFEGAETNAHKIIYDFKGITSFLAGMSGGKTLTIYFVAVPVRNNFVSCVMSFWDNDQINPSGLSPLLEQVMKLKE